MGEGKRFLGNLGWLMGGRIAIMILQLLVTLATARFLGPSNYGTINYVAAYVSFFSSIASLGLAVVVIKEIAQNPEDGNKIIWTSIWLRLIIAIISAASVVMLVYMGNNDTQLTRIAFFQSFSIVFSAFDTFNYYFQATLNAKWGSIASIIAYVAMSLYRVVLLICNASVEWFALASSVDIIVLVVFLFLFYTRFEGIHPCFYWGIAKKLLRQSYYYLIAGLLSILLEQIDRIMIGNMLNTTSVGIYSASLTITTIWSVLPSALIQSVSPILYETAKRDRVLYLRRIRQTYAVLFWLNVLYSVSVSILGRWILRIMFGEEYISGLGALRIVVWYYGISTMSMVTSVYLANDYKDKYINAFATVGVLVDVLLNTLLIPAMGIEGAAIATLFTNVIVQIGVPWLIPDIRELAMEIIQGITLRKVANKEEIQMIMISAQKALKRNK